MLLDFLLDDTYDGSDSQIGAARYLGRMDKTVLKSQKERLQQAQANEVLWKRPFPQDKKLEWL